MATFALKSLFKERESLHRKSVPLAGEHSRGPRQQVPTSVKCSRCKSVSHISPPNKRVVVLAVGAAEPSHLSDVFLALGEDAEQADVAEKPSLLPLCSAYVPWPRETSAQWFHKNTVTQLFSFFIFLLKASSKKTEV